MHGMAPGAYAQHSSTAPFLSPGAVEPLSRQLVERALGPDPSVHAWRAGGPVLPGPPPPGELARRLAEIDIAYLTDGELDAYARACRRLAEWAAGCGRMARAELAARGTAGP